jgi:hypothetical protein
MKSTCLCLVLVLAFTCLGYAATIHVPGDQPTIQAGIDAASAGDTVLVADGTYTGIGNKNLDFNGKAITVTSEKGAESTIIDCEGDGRGVYFHSGETETSVVSGFTITNGFTEHGGGIRCENSSSPTIERNIIVGNSASNSGGGIRCANFSSPIFRNNIIAGNSANGAGGIYCYQSSPIIVNTTISGNGANISEGGGIYCRKYSYPTIKNTILWENSPDEIYLFPGSEPSEIDITYSDIQDGWSGEGNIAANPLFVDGYHLHPSSPCIDAGTPDGAPSDDIEGNPRDAFPDMGAYEYQGIDIGSIEIISPTDGDESYIGDIVDVIAEVRDRSGNPAEDVEVNFETISGIVDPVVAITDENGQAITQLTVAEGENIVTAIVTDDIFDTVTVTGIVPVGSINGNVMDTVGRPVKFALVIAINTDTKDRYKTFTDSNGDYNIPDVLSGICWVICIKKGYKAGIKKAEVVAGETTTVDFMLHPKME